MPELDIKLLGGFHLVSDGKPITRLNSPRLQSLLAYLLLHLDTPVSRPQLAFLLWPESEEAKALNSLRVALHTLRRTLPHADDAINIDTQCVQWRTTPALRLDVVAFESAVAAASHGLAATACDAWQSAVELYAADLLPGCYDSWIEPHRERLRQMFITALQQLTEALEGVGDYRAAIVYAERLLHHEPLREDVYRQLMRLHALVGDRAGVQRTYLTCVAVLKRELGIEPGTVTQNAYAHLLREGALSPTGSARSSASSTHLPTPTSSFVGRANEIAEVRRALAHHRLVTLTGAGGCGKTRLALQVATSLLADAQFADGAAWVDLAPLTDPGLVPQAVATAVGVRERPGQSLVETLSEALRVRHLLLVLDNCEHLVGACSSLADRLLHTCPRVVLLATSREPLGLAEGITWAAPPLALPSPPSSLATADDIIRLTHADAVQLFIARALDTLPTFRLTTGNARAVVQVCHRLDGLPLAIELAAARVKVLSVEQIAQRLDRAFNLLTRGAPTALPRHQTLRATMDWSYNLLSESERVLLRRLSVFAGGFTLGMAEAVAADGRREMGDRGWPSAISDPHSPLSQGEVLDLLSELVDRSLVVVDASDSVGEARYRLLETVRQYAAEQLAGDDEESCVRDRHLAFCVQLAEQAEPELAGARQAAWMERLEREHDNLRAALQWAYEREQSALGLRLAAACASFWFTRGYVSEGVRWLERLLSQPQAETGDLAIQARATYQAAKLRWRGGDLTEAGVMAEASLRAARALDDARNAGRALNLLGVLALDQGDSSRAQGLFEESVALFDRLDDSAGKVTPLFNLAGVASERGDYRRALESYEALLSAHRQLGQQSGVALILVTLSHVALYLGDYPRAHAALLEGLALAIEVKDKHNELLALNNLGVLARYHGDYTRAAELNAQGLRLAREIGNPRDVARALWNQGEVARLQGDLATALTHFEHARSLYLSVADSRGETLCRRGLAATYGALGDWTRAGAFYTENLGQQYGWGDRLGVAQSLEGLASVAAATGGPERAARYLAQAAALRARLETPHTPAERAALEPLKVQVRARLGEPTWAAAWTEGEVMTVEQAIEGARLLV